jgi:hypothetical protein
MSVRAATLLAAVCLALLVLVWILAALMVKRVNSVAGWTAHSVQVEARVSELLGQTQHLRIGERAMSSQALRFSQALSIGGRPHSSLAR